MRSSSRGSRAARCGERVLQGERLDVCVRAIGVPRLHPHDLHHAENTIAAEPGTGLKDLMVRMGHDGVRVAMIYQTRLAFWYPLDDQRPKWHAKTNRLEQDQSPDLENSGRPGLSAVERVTGIEPAPSASKERSPAAQTDPGADAVRDRVARRSVPRLRGR